MNPDESFPGTQAHGENVRALLRAVRDLVSADREMRQSICGRMQLGETDMRAVRFVMARVRAGSPASPRDVAAHLGITTAATTTLLDRLVRAGHVERLPHHRDRRSKVVVPTAHAWEEAGRELAAVHDRMYAVAAGVPASARPAVLSFLGDLSDVMRLDV